jgi:hypothetical protein
MGTYHDDRSAGHKLVLLIFKVIVSIVWKCYHAMFAMLSMYGSRRCNRPSLLKALFSGGRSTRLILIFSADDDSAMFSSRTVRPDPEILDSIYQAWKTSGR